MPKKRKSRIDQKKLTKGQIRKLNALRKSLGDDIADKAFTEWLETQAHHEPEDKNAQRIAEALAGLVKQKQLSIRRGGYLVTRGRGRVIVTPAE